MFLLAQIVMTGGLLVSLLLSVIMLVSKKTFLDAEKLSPFECGFLPKNSSRSNFSLQFFLITLIFLIFDVELILIFPYLGIFMTSSPLLSATMLVLFILILALGLFWEWSLSMLEWVS